MTKEQLSCFQKRYIIPRNLKREKTKINILMQNATDIKNHQNFLFSIPKRDREFLDYYISLAMPLLRQGRVARRSLIKLHRPLA